MINKKGELNLTETILQTKELTKRFGKQVVVQKVNMRIQKGDIYGFIGKNGAGKSTFLRMVTGLVHPTSGEIFLFSQKGKNALPRIGSIIEQPALYPDFTAYQNMELRAKILGLTDKKMIRNILALVGLEDTARKKAKHFSLGMKQRLGLALALLGSPDFLILDEPTNGLDPEGMVEMRNLLKQLNEEQGITILVSSHILGELSKIATRYGIIHKGVLVDEFSREELDYRCRKYLQIKVSDAPATTFILEKIFQTTDYEVLPENIIKIYDLLDMSGEICLELAKQNIKVFSIESKGEDLEGYFMNLMEGKKHA